MNRRQRKKELVKRCYGGLVSQFFDAKEVAFGTTPSQKKLGRVKTAKQLRNATTIVWAGIEDEDWKRYRRIKGGGHE